MTIPAFDPKLLRRSPLSKEAGRPDSWVRGDANRS